MTKSGPIYLNLSTAL